MEKHIGTLYPPERLETTPIDAQWLLGQGAGVWFSIEKTSANNIEVKQQNMVINLNKILNI